MPKFENWGWNVNWVSPADLKGAKIKRISDGALIADVSARGVGSQEECNRNAALMAASPQLYRALLDLVTVCNRDTFLSTVFESLAGPSGTMNNALCALEQVGLPLPEWFFGDRSESTQQQEEVSDNA